MSSFQLLWRCAHHTSALENFFERRKACEQACETQELKWYHGGEYPPTATKKILTEN